MSRHRKRGFPPRLDNTPAAQNLGQRPRRRAPSLARLIYRAVRSAGAGSHRVRAGAIRALVAIAILCGVVFGASQLYVYARPRTIGVCVVSDVSYRLGKPDWEAALRPVFDQVNRIFANTGVRWRVDKTTNASDTVSPDGLRERMESMNVPECRSDVVLGLTVATDDQPDSIAPAFSHVLVVNQQGARQGDMAATAIALGLAKLFGSPISTRTLVFADAANGEVFDAVTIRLIRQMRDYNFAGGISAMTPKWDSRALAEITAAAARRYARPDAEAHRTLARAMDYGYRPDDALAHLRAAVSLEPDDYATRFYYGKVLEKNGATEQAIAEFRAAAKVQPANPAPHRAIASVYYHMNRLPEAVSELRTAVSLDPRDSDNQVALGQVTQEAGKLPTPDENPDDRLKSGTFDWYKVAEHPAQPPRAK